MHVHAHTDNTNAHCAMLSACTPDLHSTQSSADAFESAFLAALDVLEKDHLAEIPGFKSQPLTCLTLCDIR